MKANGSYGSSARKSALGEDQRWERWEESKFLAGALFATCTSPFRHSSSAHRICVLAIRVLRDQPHPFTHRPLLPAVRLAHARIPLTPPPDSPRLHRSSCLADQRHIYPGAAWQPPITIAPGSAEEHGARRQRRFAPPKYSASFQHLLIQSWLSQTAPVLNPWPLSSSRHRAALFELMQTPGAPNAPQQRALQLTHTSGRIAAFSFLRNSAFQLNLVPIWSVKTFCKAFFELCCCGIMFSCSNLPLPVPTARADFVRYSLCDGKKLLTGG